MQQKSQYDWLGNTVATADDANAFYDRSLGEIKNEVYQLKTATGITGNLSASYDVAGNMQSLTVHRDGPCVGSCNDQHFTYEWDEVGRLSAARRWDQVPWENLAPAAEMHYAYDASDMRVRKTVTLPGGVERHTVYIFGSLELRMAGWDEEIGYEISERTEVPYLMSGGERLGRVVHTIAPDTLEPTTRVFLELGDHLGSSSVVLDRATGELVERRTAYAYGAVESDFRPGRWHEFREDYRFTGKEDDVEVGLTYFGKRYYAPLLGRWMSPDPLAIHEPGRADENLYAYVNGRVCAAVDPLGLVAVLPVLGAMALGAAIGGAINLGIQGANAAFYGKEFSGSSFLASMAGGAVSGGLGGWAGGASGLGSASMGVFQAYGASAAGGFVSGGMRDGGWSWGHAFQGSALSLGTSAVLNHDLGMRPFNSAVIGGSGGSTSFGEGTAGEIAISTSVATHIGGWAGKYTLLGSKLGAAMAATNGALTGSRGVYNWGRPSGWLAFGLDSSWGLTGTTLGNALVATNAIWPGGAQFDSGESKRKNRQVYLEGFYTPAQPGYAFTQGNVISNLNRTSGGHSGELLAHESFHVTQSRLAGKWFQYSYLGWTGFFGGIGLAFGGQAKSAGYKQNPWEVTAREPKARFPNELFGW